MLSVTVKVTGLDTTQNRLTRLKDSFSDWTEVLSSLSATLLRFYEDTVFDSAGQALSEAWKPLTSKTDSYKRSHWPGRGILERTGDLRHGFTGDVTPVSLFITNKDPKFLFHQLGTGTGTGRGHNIPARKMLAVNGTVEEIIRTEVEAGVRAKIEASRI